jgi:O-antigen ligase
MLVIFLTCLFLAPQVWLEPFVGLPTDFLIYPAWIGLTVVQRRWMPRGVQHIDVVFGLFLFWLVMTTLVNGFQPARGYGNPSSVGYIINYVKFFVLFQLIIGYVRDRGKVARFGHLLVAFGGILVVESIHHKLTGVGWAGQGLGWVDPDVLAAGGTGRTRWVHIFDGPGVFCVIFTIALPFVMQYLDKWQPPLKKLLGAGGVLALLLAIYLTGSRGGFLATLFMLALYVALRYRVSPTRLVAGAGLSAVLFLAAPSQLTTMRDQSRSADYRIEMWAEGIEMATQNPVFGIGRGNFVRYTAKLIAHNSAIEIMGEMGFVGFSFWVALIYLCVKGTWRTYTTAGDAATKSLAAAALIALGGYIVSSMFVTLEYETFYILLGLCVGAGLISGEPVRLSKRDLRNILGIVAGWFVVLKAFVMAYFA